MEGKLLEEATAPLVDALGEPGPCMSRLRPHDVTLPSPPTMCPMWYESSKSHILPWAFSLQRLALAEDRYIGGGAHGVIL